MWTYEFPDMKHCALRNSDRLFQEGNLSAIRGEGGEDMKIFDIAAVRTKSGGVREERPISWVPGGQDMLTYRLEQCPHAGGFVDDIARP